MNKSIYSVAQVNAYIRNMFSQDLPLRNVSVKGEVSNCNYHQSGHIYFTLKDEGGTIAALMFSSDRKGLGFPMKNGDKVVVTGRVDVYVQGGKYQIYARKIEREGAGDIYLRLEALKRELEEMGMFALEYKQPIPKYASRVGIVTAPGGAAIRDIMNIAMRRNPYVQLILYPALVQGEGAAASIVEGIRALDRLGVDVIIIGRGGGAVEDLWAFNNEAVARAIFDCRTPIISAVGHETNWSIADLAADHREPTPTAAAQAAVFDYAQTKELLIREQGRLNDRMRRIVLVMRQRTQLLEARLQRVSPKNQLFEKKQQLMGLEDELRRCMEKLFVERRHRLMLLAGALDACSPAKKLSQGFSHISTEDGRTLRSVQQTKPGARIEVHLTDGSLTAEVCEVVQTGKGTEIEP